MENVGKFNIEVDGYYYSVTILPKKEAIKTLKGFSSTDKWDDDESYYSSDRHYYPLKNSKLRVDDILVIPYTKKTLEINKTDFSMSDKGYDYWLNEK